MIVDFRISLQNSKNAIVSWASSNADNISWIYADGGLVRGPLALGTLNRTMQIPMVDGITRALEVHDFAIDESPSNPVEIRPNTRPIIQWIASATGKRYKVYHTPFGGSESLIYNRLAEGDKVNYILKSPALLVAGWHFFRVEALDEFGNESVRANWNYLVFDLPAPATDLEIVDGSGANLFDITIT